MPVPRIRGEGSPCLVPVSALEANTSGNAWLLTFGIFEAGFGE
jgi:hypothetical protein